MVEIKTEGHKINKEIFPKRIKEKKGGNLVEKQYGPIIGKIRRAKRIKALTIARHLEISLSTYSRIETGHRSASFERITTICGLLGLTLTQLNEALATERSGK